MSLRREFRNELQALQQGEPAMAMKFADLWRWDGKVGRGKYAAVGLIGVVIKHNLDRLISGWFFGYEKIFSTTGRRWGRPRDSTIYRVRKRNFSPRCCCSRSRFCGWGWR